MKVLTVGQAAKLCKVAPRTVTKWFDLGLLKGYRLPCSSDRRIPYGNLVKFLTDNKMPLELLTEEPETPEQAVEVGVEIRK